MSLVEKLGDVFFPVHGTTEWLCLFQAILVISELERITPWPGVL